MDALVLAFGWSDVFALTSVRRWTETLDGFLDVLQRDHPGTPCVVVGLPPMDQLGIARILGPIVRWHGERLNEASLDVLRRRSDAGFVPLGPPANRDERPWGSPEAYDAWSLPVALGLRSALQAAGHTPDTTWRSDRVDHLEDLFEESAVVPFSFTLQRAFRSGAPHRTSGRTGPSKTSTRPRLVVRVFDALRMRTWIHQYAMHVLDDLGHPALVSEFGAPHRHARGRPTAAQGAVLRGRPGDGLRRTGSI